ncbi:ubiquitin-domain-containing protein [Laetiporus sulphureus 93-53]|uniref:Ubiquitin-domain-containing protein n=1 Tax=Laetiporus sulphureus 93-53 TaxID=1314785 RepID=A0A165BH49_9APHY|nr:ubiquitin-domain-containing protein [Laetiporus sulphureus 93-53]KZT01047.1 ubiquitin-domain-containing protein [Laetiporus sulphureus 93-53]
MAEQAELAFVKSFASNLSSQPVIYADDFQEPPEKSLKKIPVLPVEVPPPPESKAPVAAPIGSLSITFKSIKPAKTYNLTVQSTDTISDIKSQLAAEPGAPPADVQRLLLKGKAFADGKLLQEYSVKDGDIINLIIKPGFDWDPSKVPAPSSPRIAEGNIVLLPEPAQHKTRMGHGRIPSVVLSPSPSISPSPGETLVDIPLILDTSNSPSSPQSPRINTSYYATISQPTFWEHIQKFLESEFPNNMDAATAWENFFCASKGELSASEIAKIRDHVGMIGMAGT